LIFLLITTYTGAIFMFEILYKICEVFYFEVIKSEKLSKSKKLLYSFFMGFGGIAFVFLIGFLLLVWFTKSDYAIKFSLAFITLAIGLLTVIVYYSVIPLEIFNNREERKDGETLENCLIGIWIIFLIIIGCLMSPVYSEISGYYSQKSIEIELKPNIFTAINNTPPILSVDYSPPNITGYFSLFDINYAQCRWSTNYGYFFTMNPHASSIKKYQQEVIIPRCPYFNDTVYWTYDLSDYNKQKPPVYIGFVIEDINKKQTLGENSTSFYWAENNTDTIKLVNKTLNYS
jgi:vacuolar-type H+-ATPase subunit I/STV1